jgi:hypothetical protein
VGGRAGTACPLGSLSGNLPSSCVTDITRGGTDRCLEPKSGVSEPCCGLGAPHLFFTFSPRKVWRALASVPKGRWLFAADPFPSQALSGPPPVPVPIGFSKAALKSSQLWSHCGLQKDGRLPPAILLEISYFLCGEQHHQPHGAWGRNPEGLVSIIRLGDFCKKHRMGGGWGGAWRRVRLPLLQMGKSRFVNAAYRENALENFIS